MSIEATRLVDWYDEDGFKEGTKAPHKWVLQAAEELRRLRDENAALRQAIEQAESDIRYTDIQLAEMILSDCGHSSEYTSLLHRVAARITQHVGQAIEQAEKQEPVGTYEGVMEAMLSLRNGTLEQQQVYGHMKDKLLYAAPQKREWIGLTDDELRAAYRKGRDSIPSPDSGWEWVDNHTPGLREVELTLYRKNNNGDVV